MKANDDRHTVYDLGKDASCITQLFNTTCQMVEITHVAA